VRNSEQILEANPRFNMPNQFENSGNPEIHRRTTAQEIWRDTGGKIDVLEPSGKLSSSNAIGSRFN